MNKTIADRADMMFLSGRGIRASILSGALRAVSQKRAPACRLRQEVSYFEASLKFAAVRAGWPRHAIGELQTVRTIFLELMISSLHSSNMRKEKGDPDGSPLWS